MIDYIGDVSRQDATLLRQLAHRSASILEFGCGASTQILAAYAIGSIESVDTENAWIDRTQSHLVNLGLGGTVAFRLYDDFSPSGPYDLIFVDGLNELRLPFAMKTWQALAVGGAMCFHDTRRTMPHGRATTSDVQNVCAVIEHHSTEIDRVVLNQADSNITVITKRAPLLLVDYMKAEGRTPQQMGIA